MIDSGRVFDGVAVLTALGALAASSSHAVRVPLAEPPRAPSRRTT